MSVSRTDIPVRQRGKKKKKCDAEKTRIILININFTFEHFSMIEGFVQKDKINIINLFYLKIKKTYNFKLKNKKKIIL